MSSANMCFSVPSSSRTSARSPLASYSSPYENPNDLVCEAPESPKPIAKKATGQLAPSFMRVATVTSGGSGILAGCDCGDYRTRSIRTKCETGDTRTSYSGPEGTEGVGICTAKKEHCVDEFDETDKSQGKWVTDKEETTPQKEECNGVNDNCDGATDEGLGQTTCGLGECEHTVDNCKGGKSQECNPLEGQSEEACDGRDNNCDGETDEGFGQTTCGDGECTHTVDNCKDGASQSCDPLEGQSEEVCDNKDNNCDGRTDEGELLQSSYSGDPATRNIGICLEEKRKCINGTYDGDDHITQTQVLPKAAEACNDQDDNCDGATDEGGVCCTEWENTYGGNGISYAKYVIQTNDNGFMMTGVKRPLISSNTVGEEEGLIIKTDVAGNIQWSVSPWNGFANSAYQNNDGSILVAGTVAGTVGSNASLTKMDDLGNILWSRTFSGLGISFARSLQHSIDGGMVLAGANISPTNDRYVYGWTLKTDALGNAVRENSYICPNSSGGYWGGGSFSSIRQTLDRGFIMVGRDNRDDMPRDQFWLVKSDEFGNEQWNRTYTNSFNFVVGGFSSPSVQQTQDGGFIMAGNNFGNQPLGGALIIKTDSSGNEMWRKIFNPTNFNGFYANSIQTTQDGGFVFAVNQDSFTAPINIEARLIKIDRFGNEEWHKTYHGPASGRVIQSSIYSVQQINDGSFILAGETPSPIDGRHAFWLVHACPPVQ